MVDEVFMFSTIYNLWSEIKTYSYQEIATYIFPNYLKIYLQRISRDRKKKAIVSIRKTSLNFHGLLFPEEKEEEKTTGWEERKINHTSLST